MDIYAVPDAGGYEAWGQVEAYCQVGNTTQTVPCLYINLDSVFANAASGQRNVTVVCEADCTPGRLTTGAIDIFPYVGGHDCASSLGHNVWTVALKDLTIETTPNNFFYVDEVPNYNDGPNYSSGHYWVCP